VKERESERGEERVYCQVIESLAALPLISITVRDRETATQCNKLQLQHTTRHCNTFATHCNTLQHSQVAPDPLCSRIHKCGKPQHTATHYSTLQHTLQHTHVTPDPLCSRIPRCNTPKLTATRCNTLQRPHVAPGSLCSRIPKCNTLQYTASYYTAR